MTPADRLATATAAFLAVCEIEPLNVKFIPPWHVASFALDRLALTIFRAGPDADGDQAVLAWAEEAERAVRHFKTMVDWLDA